MTYQLHITKKAEEDLDAAVYHIAYVLLNPQAADELVDKVEEEANKLAEFPEKHPLVSDPVLNAWGIRYVTVKNYIAFYIISEEERTVHIIRFLHQRRHWLGILKTET